MTLPLRETELVQVSSTHNALMTAHTLIVQVSRNLEAVDQTLERPGSLSCTFQRVRVYVAAKRNVALIFTSKTLDRPRVR